MIIVGNWLLCEDGVTRPTVRGAVHAGRADPLTIVFLIDTGADRSAFSKDVLDNLNLPSARQPPDYRLEGVGGTSPFVLVKTVIELTRNDGAPARIRGEYAAFTDAKAVDLSILGRDVLDNFDVIQSRRRNQVLLLAGNHQYQVTEA